MKKIVALLAALTATACGDIPQPFRHDGLNAAVIPVAARGVAVTPVEETERGRRLADSIVRRLLQEEVPASIRPVTAGAATITAEIEPGPAATLFRWRLSRPESEPTELLQRVPNGAWERASPKTIETMAAEVVEALSPPLMGGTLGPEAERAAAQAARPSVKLIPPAGLPGDGDKALAAAMAKALEAAGLRLAESGALFQAKGQATLVPGKAGEDILALSWTVTGKDGETLGTSSQQGPAPKGRLAGPWGSLAADIAAGGAEGVLEIIRATLR